MKLVWCGILIVFGMGCGLLTATFPMVTPSEATTMPPAFTTASTRMPALTTEVMSPNTTPSTVLPPTWTLPAVSTTYQVGTPAVVSFQGSVLLKEGMCCIGGIVGTVVDLRKDFAARSMYGPVTEMRRKEGMFCFSEAELADAAWEPFKASVTEPFAITAINWVGHFISVQYRDSLGNLSAVACDDISVEGMPALPTPGVTSAPV